MKLLICGGGNGAHVLTAIASSRNIETRVLSLYQNEAEVWSKSLQERPLQCCMPSDSGEETVLTSSPRCVSNKPEEVVPGAEVILITAPAFSHQIYLTAIEPYITSPAVIVGCPGQSGFEFQACSILKNKLSLVSILCTETLPFACRIIQYGREVKVLGIKEAVTVLIITQNSAHHKNPVELLQNVLGDKPKLVSTNNFLENSLQVAELHPGIMYGKWKDWDGVPSKSKPLFYHGVDDIQTHYLEMLSKERLEIASSLSKQLPSVNTSGCVSSYDWLVDSYGSALKDTTNLQTAFRTNTAYDGLVHPMMAVEGGFVPDFKYRYLAEEIPYGLVVMKGLALLLGLDTPVIDEVTLWGQEKLGKEYLVEGKLNGKNMDETRAPQVYGINSLDDLGVFVKDCL